MLSHGPFCPVIFATDRRNGLQTFTYRGLIEAQPPGTLVDTLVHADDRADFDRRFIATSSRRPATSFYSAHG